MNRRSIRAHLDVCQNVVVCPNKAELYYLSHNPSWWNNPGKHLVCCCIQHGYNSPRMEKISREEADMFLIMDE